MCERFRPFCPSPPAPPPPHHPWAAPKKPILNRVKILGSWSTFFTLVKCSAKFFQTVFQLYLYFHQKRPEFNISHQMLLEPNLLFFQTLLLYHNGMFSFYFLQLPMLIEFFASSWASANKFPVVAAEGSGPSKCIFIGWSRTDSIIRQKLFHPTSIVKRLFQRLI